MIDESSTTLWVGNLSEQVTEELLYELFLQAGPLEKVRIARDRDGRQKTFAFITYCHEISVPYAINLFRGTALYHKTLLLQCRGRMPLLPPPIRCYGPEPPMNFTQAVPEQFADMTRNIIDDDLKTVNTPRQNLDANDKLVLASLQGNWTHRHHPYRQKEKPRDHRDDYRGRDNHHGDHRSNNRQHGHWRERRNNRRGNYHKRD